MHLFLIALIVSLFWFVVRPWWRDRKQVAKARRAAAANAALRGRPLTDAEVAAFRDWHASQSIACVRLDAASQPPKLTPGGTRIGGPAWLMVGEAWPLDRSGAPMEFLAQVDFADLPPLEDFPRSGLLQFFIARDDYYGCDFDNPLGGDVRIIWRETLAGEGVLTTRPMVTDEDMSPLSARAREQAIGLIPSLTNQQPGFSTDWALREMDQLLVRDDGRLDQYWDQSANLLGDVHHVGGYPDFTQYDFRNANCCPDHDVVLLQLWSEPIRDICWGDAGQANFMISRADLLARDFSRVSYQWDCT